MNNLNKISVSQKELLAQLVNFERNKEQIVREIQESFNIYKKRFWFGFEFPKSIVRIKKMNNKQLANHNDGLEDKNGTTCFIDFNSTFIALNWGDKKIVEADRTLIEYVLLHEMIHVYQNHILSEVHNDSQQKHGRSFKSEAKRLGLSVRGRLAACEYLVRMPDVN